MELGGGEGGGDVVMHLATFGLSVSFLSVKFPRVSELIIFDIFQIIMIHCFFFPISNTF